MVNKGENRYFKGSHISERKFRQIIKYFSMDITASQTAQLTQVSRQTTNKLYARIRERIKEQCEYESPLKGEVEVDES